MCVFGIDLGGTKRKSLRLMQETLGFAIVCLRRRRIISKRETIATLVDMAEQATGQTGSVGIGIRFSLALHRRGKTLILRGLTAGRSCLLM